MAEVENKKKVVKKKVVKKIKEPSAMDNYEDAEPLGNSDSGAQAAVKWGVRAVILLALLIAAYKIVPPYLQAQKAEPVWNEGLDAYRAKDYDKAISKMNEAKELAPDWPEIHARYPEQIARVYCSKGLDLVDSGKNEEALEALLKVIDNNKSVAVENGVYFAIADCYNRLGKLHKALEYSKLEVDNNGKDAKTAQGMVKLLVKKIADGQ
ncbi:MAG: hypothetical protein JXR97_03230 [Planctomycetes bacterium]|nr:hypothetical protein [Planctomycetota bacterium]